MSAPSDKKAMEFAPEPPVPDITQAIFALAESIKAGQVNNAQASEQISAMQAFLMDREAARPHENVFNPPMKSDFNPEGDRDNPKPDLKCKMHWVGYRMSKDTLRKSEIELLNRVQPGSYRVTKSDGRSIPLTVNARYDDAGRLEQMNIAFPCKNVEDRMNHLSMESYLREVLGDSQSTESLRAQIEQLKVQLQAHPTVLETPRDLSNPPG